MRLRYIELNPKDMQNVVLDYSLGASEEMHCANEQGWVEFLGQRIAFNTDLAAERRMESLLVPPLVVAARLAGGPPVDRGYDGRAFAVLGSGLQDVVRYYAGG